MVTKSRASASVAALGALPAITHTVGAVFQPVSAVLAHLGAALLLKRLEGIEFLGLLRGEDCPNGCLRLRLLFYHLRAARFHVGFPCVRARLAIGRCGALALGARALLLTRGLLRLLPGLHNLADLRFLIGGEVERDRQHVEAVLEVLGCAHAVTCGAGRVLRR